MTKIIFTIAAIVFLFSNSFAQAKVATPKKPTYISVAKFKPPVTKTYLGNYSGTQLLNAAEVKSIIAMPILIKDAKGVIYKIVSYYLAYKRIGVKEDEKTGKIEEATDSDIQRFDKAPLPDLWQNAIQENLHKGEQLYFFDVMVRDTKGRIFQSPDLKITIK